MDRSSQCCVDDNLEQTERGADRVRLERQRWAGCQKAVHDVVWIRRESDEEKQLGPLFDRADHLLNCTCRLQPASDGFLKQ